MVMKMIRDKDFLYEKLKAGIFESMIFEMIRDKSFIRSMTNIEKRA